MNKVYRYCLVKLAQSLRFCRLNKWAMSIFDYIDGKPDFDLNEKIEVYKHYEWRMPSFSPFNYLYGEYYVDGKLLDYVTEYNEQNNYIVQQIPEVGSFYQDWASVKYKKNVIFGKVLKLIRKNNEVFAVYMEKL